MTLFGKAWRGAQRFVQDVRIDADFPRYEFEQHGAHELVASRRFDTSQLEREIDAIRLAAEAEGRAAYAARICQSESSIDALRPAITRLRTQLEVLTRNYRQELDLLYEEKMNLLKAKQALFEQMKALQKERSEAQEELSAVYDDLKTVKSLIDSWYAKSERTPWLFGNGGERLPNRSLFGQSFGDLDGYKADRMRACEEVGTCKAAVAEVAGRQKTNKSLLDGNKADLNRVFESIKTVKEARQRMFDIKDQGVRHHRVEAELSTWLQQEADLQNDLIRLTSAKVELVEQQAFRLGIEERKQTMAELRKKRTDFLAAFDDPGNRTERQRTHRDAWLKGREAA